MIEEKRERITAEELTPFEPALPIPPEAPYCRSCHHYSEPGSERCTGCGSDILDSFVASDVNWGEPNDDPRDMPSEI